MMRVISTWFYAHSAVDSGEYAQVRGNASTNRFQDVYRRCIAVFFETARRANPDARLVLLTNRPWEAAASRDANAAARVLARCGVEIVVLPYNHAPPPSFPKSWWNQFFVLDVLAWAAASLGPEDSLLVLDSDIVWSGHESTARLWAELERKRVLTYAVPYAEDTPINGLTRRQMSRGFTRSSDPALAYCGGEFIAVFGSHVSRLSETASAIYRQKLADSRDGLAFAFEEAHVLSWAYHLMHVESGTGNPYIKRIWTQPLKPRNTSPDDLDLALWHVPAEKKYGLRRIFKKLNSTEPLPRDLSQIVGLPANTKTKWVLDVTAALAGRVRERVKNR